MNRSIKRKQVMKIANDVIKHRTKIREKALAKKPIGLGLIVTTHLIAIIFWRYTLTLMDRRLK